MLALFQTICDVVTSANRMYNIRKICAYESHHIDKSSYFVQNSTRTRTSTRSSLLPSVFVAHMHDAQHQHGGGEGFGDMNVC